MRPRKRGVRARDLELQGVATGNRPHIGPRGRNHRNAGLFDHEGVLLMSTRMTRTRKGFAALLAAATLVASLGVASALAVHDHPDQLIQLDRDAYTSTYP